MIWTAGSLLKVSPLLSALSVADPHAGYLDFYPVLNLTHHILHSQDSDEPVTGCHGSALPADYDFGFTFCSYLMNSRNQEANWRSPFHIGQDSPCQSLLQTIIWIPLGLGIQPPLAN